MIWNSVEDCEYPICDADEAVPVWVVVDGEAIEAWYRNPEMNDCWFESDTGKELEVTWWMESLSVVGKPDLPNL
tara:strand:+ start:512 stop:733 length:222 start_codon:yes stop_codon:yes gene_type:complete